jgi:hypothetical protein
MIGRGRMSPTPNWSGSFEQRAWTTGASTPSAISMQVHALPFLQPVDLIRRPSCSLLTCSLMWFCPSPEPATNSGMRCHDRADLNGTARGHGRVSRTRSRCSAITSGVPGTSAHGGPVSDEHICGAHSRPGPHELLASASSIRAGKVVDPQ